MRCRVCDSVTTLCAQRRDVFLYRCQVCGFVSGKPARWIEPDQYYESYHCGPAPPAPEARYREWLSRAEATVGQGRLLEVGAGSGGFVRVARARGWRVDATEISKSGVEALLGTGATVFAGDVLAAGYPDKQFDMVVSLEVLEHVSAPLRYLREFWRVTRPGGLLLLTTPNFNGLSRRYLSVQWRVIAPEHLGYFTPATLSHALREAGYQRVYVRSRSVDVLSWRRSATPANVVHFDPYASARLRDRIEADKFLRLGKAALNSILGMTGLGDSLLAWAHQ